MKRYRRRDEERAMAEHDARIRAVLEQAVHDGASCVIAMTLNEQHGVVEHWVDALWDGLRDDLSDDRPDMAGLVQEDRLRAIVLLLDDRVQAEAAKVIRGLRKTR